MRSKCRCSCVLQFTLCHGFSSVLHRPPSQLIHCMEVYRYDGSISSEEVFVNRFHNSLARVVGNTATLLNRRELFNNPLQGTGNTTEQSTLDPGTKLVDPGRRRLTTRGRQASSPRRACKGASTLTHPSRLRLPKHSVCTGGAHQNL